MKIYLAGKISENDWRTELVANLGKLRLDDWCETSSLPMYQCHTYVGPFFVHCKHGCTENSEHRSVSACGDGATRRQVFDKSRSGIRRADVVIVYAGLDFATAHGTHAEIGYAGALRKRIVIVAHPKLKLNEFWFIRGFASDTYYAESPSVGVRNAINAIWLRGEGK